jgi:hypothetical protein
MTTAGGSCRRMQAPVENIRLSPMRLARESTASVAFSYRDTISRRTITYEIAICSFRSHPGRHRRSPACLARYVGLCLLPRHGLGQAHDDLGLNQSKVMNVIDPKSLARDASGKPLSTFSRPPPAHDPCSSGPMNIRHIGIIVPGPGIDAAAF